MILAQEKNKIGQPNISLEKLGCEISNAFNVPDSESEPGLFKKNMVWPIGN